MSDDVNRALEEATNRIRKKERLESKLDEIADQVSRLKAMEIRLAKELARERKDVEDLERLSLASILQSFIGNKAEKLLREREEYARARLGHEECVTELEELRSELAEVEQGLVPLEDAEEQYDLAVRAKEAFLQQCDSPTGKELAEIAERVAELDSDLVEINEAIHAGRVARSAVRRVSRKLDTASDWGAVDMLGGGLFTTMAKHGAIDKARDHSRVAQRSLQRFQQELADVGKRFEASVSLGEFHEFMDYFLDGIIIDSMVQSKINRSLARTQSTAKRVSATLRELERLREAAEAKREDLTERREALLGVDQVNHSRREDA